MSSAARRIVEFRVLIDVDEDAAQDIDGGVLFSDPWRAFTKALRTAMRDGALDELPDELDAHVTVKSQSLTLPWRGPPKVAA